VLVNELARPALFPNLHVADRDPAGALRFVARPLDQTVSKIR
jgi:hypothetical protein